ncbi:indole-3-glycerol phosphate synthase TrpC [Kaistella palustris]|uniref:indole-3-glycerol phosphate synthase TrpC n=1 Tax=Kaistella palustris TaxID=493376 RepID=UPI0003FD62C4|nr:indole-3-glycerol phosphate synthase TrpC [Kaistella palustris]
MNILEQITARKKAEVETAKIVQSKEELKDSEFFTRGTLSLKKSVREGSGIIAEFKRKSPSKGIINDKVTIVDVSQSYEKVGASGISVLTDGDFFGGSFGDILAARKTVQIPVLRKDFMIDEYQFYEAKALGADVVLLIAACLSPAQVQEFTDLAHELELEVLLEIHTENELHHFNRKVDLVGINNRNLKDFKVDLQHSVDLKNILPTDVITIAESGINSISDYQYLKEKGFDGFLMGEFFMKNDNPGMAFEDFMLKKDSLKRRSV